MAPEPLSSSSQSPPWMFQKHYAQFNEFASKVWGKPNAVVKHHIDSAMEFDYIDLGGYFPAFRSFFSGTLDVDKILICQEYRDAFEVLKTKMYYNGACVTGQPGIGKTLFNIYLLVKRLGEKKAVAVQFPDGQPMYALFQGATVSFHSLDNVRPLDIDVPLDERDSLDESPFVWALCDSNDDVQHPSSLFKGKQDQIRIIQTTSPKVSRWRQWAKQHGAEFYVMDIWFENEVRHLGTMLGLDVDRMIDLAREWGNIPRALLRNLQQSDEEIELAYRKDAARAVGYTPQFMAASIAQNLPSDPPSSFFFVRPSVIREGNITRRQFDIHVPTKSLWLMLGQALRGLDNQIKLAFYRVLSQHNQTRSSAGNIFESWFHSFVIAGNEVSCTWLSRAGVTLPETWTIPDKDDEDDHHTYPIHSSLDALSNCKPPFYWVPPNGFPGIDGLLALENQICAFQVTISPGHRSPEDGINKIQEKLRAGLKNVPFGIVFVGPQDGAIQMVARRWKGRVRFKSTRKVIPVAWSVVDPTSGVVEYRSYRDVEYVRESEEPGQLGDEMALEDRAVTPTKRRSERIATSEKHGGKWREVQKTQGHAVMATKRKPETTAMSKKRQGKQRKMD